MVAAATPFATGAGRIIGRDAKAAPITAGAVDSSPMISTPTAPAACARVSRTAPPTARRTGARPDASAAITAAAPNMSGRASQLRNDAEQYVS
ncbi:MAG: hypothetical protein U5K74_14475, partial [Gemmatimonadaceae bacterium]|nr:hypothetical protein [Gemmatimonadaceae bacterium]